MDRSACHGKYRGDQEEIKRRMPGPQVAKLKKKQANVNEDAIPKGRENRNCVSLGEVESRGIGIRAEKTCGLIVV
jgi:hypothetical protein